MTNNQTPALVTIAQTSSTAGRIFENLEKIKTEVSNAPDDSLILFNYIALTGGGLGDLKQSEKMVKDCILALTDLEKHMKNEGGNKRVVLGYLDTNFAISDQQDVQIAVISSKNGIESLNNRGVYEVVHNDKRVGVTIWNTLRAMDDDFLENLKSHRLDALAVLGPAVPYSENAEISNDKTLEILFKQYLGRLEVNVGLYVGAAGAQDRFVYDGKSRTFRRGLGVTNMLKEFEEDSETFDILELEKASLLNRVDTDINERRYNAIVTGLREYMRKNNMKSVLLGVSGGIDSALTATIAADAIGGENVYGVSMPSKYSSDGSVSDAEQLMENIGGHYRQVPIAEAVESFMKPLGLTGIAEENLQARVRGVILMGISNQEHRLVLAPGNKSELAVGYSTIYGDAVGGFAPIKDLYKVDVYAMAEWRNKQGNSPIPIDSITKAPSAELRPGQVDQESLPDYAVLDAFLTDFFENRMEITRLEKIHGKELTEDLLKKIYRAEWKRRQYPIGPKLTTRDLGNDYKAPISR